jgi:hypothetical protein
MRGVVAVAALAGLAATSAGASTAGRQRTFVLRCADAVYETPPAQPPKTYGALRLGPVVFNHLAAGARKDVSPPSGGSRFYNVASFFNVLTSARRGVTIRLVGGDPTDRLVAGRIGASRAARVIRFPVCRDAATKALLITQYGLSFLLRSPQCMTVEVRAVGSARRYRATVPIRASHC